MEKKECQFKEKLDKKEKHGHLKKLYCIYCQRETNHAEIREIGGYNEEDFKQEYNLGRFIDGNRIATKDLSDCSYTNCEYNINGKCWNSNFSNDCGHRIKESEE